MNRRNLQRGFVHAFIIPGLIVLGVVIAGIAWLSRGDRMHTRPDEENMQAMVIISQAVKLQGALERATGDGIITRDAVGIIDLNSTLMKSSIMPRAGFPVPPANAFTKPAQWAYAQGYFRAFDAKASPDPIGSDAPDDVIYLLNLTPGVCASINHRLYGTDTRLTDAGTYDVEGGFSLSANTIEGAHGRVPGYAEGSVREGCVRSGSGYAYYKLTGVH